MRKVPRRCTTLRPPSTPALLFILSAAALITGHSLAASTSQSRPFDVAGHGRNTKFIEYDYEICPEMPSLHCKNGSTCIPGVASFGSQHDHLNLPTQDNGFHCKCPRGFIGHECGVEVDECEGLSKSANSPGSCYHGSTCRNDPNGVYCDCVELNEASDPTEAKFAGQMCEHESTSLCAVSLVGQHAPNHQFCTNHGQCVKMVAEGEPHPGCVCRDGWMGDHCELRKDAFATMPHVPSEGSGGNEEFEGKALFSLLVLPVIVAAVIGVVKKQQDNPSDIGLNVFRGEQKVKQREEQYEVENEEPANETEKTVLSIGDLEPDGSGTLGNPLEVPTKDKNEDGDMELTTTDPVVLESEVV